MEQEIQIGQKLIKPNGSVFIIAEAGVNHNGDFALAKKLVDAGKDSGVDAVKFQLFSADKLVTKSAKQAAYQSKNLGKTESQYEMLKRLELPEEAFAELKAYTESQGMTFMATPFDESAIDYLHGLDVNAFKVGSGDLTNIPYLIYMAQKGLPMIVSTGMATMDEVEAAKTAILSTGNKQVIFLHCTSNYPTPLEDANLRAMHTLSDQTNSLLGYSDHTEGILVPTAAVAMGAVVIEKHFTLDKNMEGPDHKASLEPDELAEMVKSIRLMEVVRGRAEKEPTAAELEVAKVARKSIVAAVEIPKGSLIEAKMLTIKRPGTGIAPAEFSKIIGKEAAQEIPLEALISWEMLK
ncbi:MAG: N-acetylneuraminate synthase [Bacteroidia bacterium]|nr:N-acetylneuraminate synthase [Bacteroidia bacterium]